MKGKALCFGIATLSMGVYLAAQEAPLQRNDPVFGSAERPASHAVDFPSNGNIPVPPDATTQPRLHVP